MDVVFYCNWKARLISSYILKIRYTFHKCEKLCLFPSGAQRNEFKRHIIYHTKIPLQNSTELRIEDKTCNSWEIFHCDVRSFKTFIRVKTVTLNKSTHWLDKHGNQLHATLYPMAVSHGKIFLIEIFELYLRIGTSRRLSLEDLISLRGF
jgi:hypothetical protein